MTDIYRKFDTAFRNVSAFAILRDGQHVANITLKHGNAVTAYVHYLGTEMQTGRAGGGGYDRSTAAIQSAASRMVSDSDGSALYFRNILLNECDSTRWQNALERSGFTVCGVIS